jgi:carbonic anhydrase
MHLRFALLAAFAVGVAWLAAAAHSVRPIAAGGALGELVTGNRRFASAKLGHARQDPARRAEVARREQPFAVVIACSDSRVPPELVFDQGLGDLFVVRTAGNVLDDASLASVEYAVAELGARLIVVLGHERCEIVEAALEGRALGGHAGMLAARLSPAIAAAEALRRSDALGDSLDDAIRANVRNVVAELESSMPVLAGLARSNELEILGARYDLDTGEVEFLPRRAIEPPDESSR